AWSCPANELKGRGPSRRMRGSLKCVSEVKKIMPPLAVTSDRRSLLSSVAGAFFGSTIDPDLGFPEHLECLLLGEAALARKVKRFDHPFTIRRGF
ncbi:hypothetical protein, partial [Mesorhizobium sp. M7A.F.Ca.CA.001.08.2.1]|uniref:hypothetical protein n=1 Tax=Mesorhizobium sp. M7A.F.Ca.CA.001.08.2.1 TaxID=2496692 RepID=UPI0019D31F45